MKRNRTTILETVEALAQVRAVYETLASRPIERNCTLLTECCQFKLTGKTPQLTRGEALVAAKSLRAVGRTRLPEPNDGSCPMLHPKSSRCMIYEGRPFGCRTHFCEAAGGSYSRAEVVDLIRKLEVLDAQLGGDGPHPIESAMEEALRVCSA